MKENKYRSNWIRNTRNELLAKRTWYEKYLLSCFPKKLRGKAKIQHPFIVDGKIYFADIYFPHIKVIVEVDGNSHYIRTDKDEERDKDLKNIGIVTLRINNRETLNIKIRNLLIDTIENYVPVYKEKQKQRMMRLMSQRKELKEFYENIKCKRL